MSQQGDYRAYQPDEGGGFLAGVRAVFVGLVLILVGAALATGAGVYFGLVSPQALIALVRGQLSQAAAATAPAPAEPAATTSAAAASTQPAAAGSAPAKEPVIVSQQTYGDWLYMCVEATFGVDPGCSIMQQLKIAETGAAIFVWRIAQDGKGGLVGIWQVPDAVQLSAGLTLEAGTPKPLVMPYDSCGNGSCRVVGNLSPDFIKALAAAKTVSASAILNNQQAIRFPLSAKGLADGLAALAKS